MEPSLFQLLCVTGILPTILASPKREYHLIPDAKNWIDAQAYCRSNFFDLASFENADEMAELKTANAWVGLYNDVNSWKWSIDGAPLGALKKWSNKEPDNRNGHETCAKIDQNGLWYDASCVNNNSFICYNASTTSKFVLISSPTKAWKDAQAYCRQYHTDLACPRDEAENTAAQKVVLHGSVWMGLYRDSWKWSDKTKASFFVWKPKEPDNAGGKENCALVSSGLLADNSCSDQRGFFCQTYKIMNKTILRVKLQSSQDVNDPSVKAAILEKMQEKLKEQGMAENITLTWREQPDGAVFYKKKRNDPNTESGAGGTCDP